MTGNKPQGPKSFLEHRCFHGSGVEMGVSLPLPAFQDGFSSVGDMAQHHVTITKESYFSAGIAENWLRKFYLGFIWNYSNFNVPEM